MNLAKDVLRQTMPDVADSPEFLGLLRFVVNLGAQQGGFINYLKAFVGLRGQNRKVKPATFAAAGALGPKVPHVVTGLVLMAFTAPPAYYVDGYSRFLSAMDAKGLIEKGGKEPTEITLEAEETLRWFHRACGETDSAGGSEGKRVEFLALLDSTVCRFITGKHLGKFHEECPSLAHIGEVFAEQMMKLFPEVQRAAGTKRPWTAPAATEKKAATRKPEDLAPKIITFEDGKATSSQDTFRQEVSSEVVKWAETNTFANEELAKAHVTLFLRHLTEFLRPALEAKVEVKRSSTGEVSVLARAAIPAGSIACAPTVPSASFITVMKEKGKVPPGAVRVEFMGATLLILPCTRLPPRQLKLADWPKAAFAAPFWLMNRTMVAGQANCGFSEVSMQDILTISAGNEDLHFKKPTAAQSCAGTLPVIFPFRDIAKGEELVMEDVHREKEARPAMEYQWDSVKRPKVT